MWSIWNTLALSETFNWHAADSTHKKRMFIVTARRQVYREKFHNLFSNAPSKNHIAIYWYWNDLLIICFRNSMFNSHVAAGIATGSHWSALILIVSRSNPRPWHCQKTAFDVEISQSFCMFVSNSRYLAYTICSCTFRLANTPTSNDFKKKTHKNQEKNR